MRHNNICEGGRERSRKMVLVESIGKYRVGRTIGEGSFAKVRLAVDTETGGTVAVKVIDRSTVLTNNLMYQISRAQFNFPQWIILPQKKIILSILDPSPITRAKISNIFNDKWFQEDYNPSIRTTESVYSDDCVDLEEAGTDSDSSHSTEVREVQEVILEPRRFINAFRLIAACSDLDLSGLFQEQKAKLGSPHPVQETPEMIPVAAQDVSLSVRRMSSSMVKLQDIKLLSRSMLDLTLSAEVIEVTSAHCVVEVSKSTGDLRAYKEFCESLFRLLNEGEQHPGSSSELEAVCVNDE